MIWSSDPVAATTWRIHLGITKCSFKLGMEMNLFVYMASSQGALWPYRVLGTHRCSLVVTLHAEYIKYEYYPRACGAVVSSSYHVYWRHGKPGAHSYRMHFVNQLRDGRWLGRLGWMWTKPQTPLFVRPREYNPYDNRMGICWPLTRSLKRCIKTIVVKKNVTAHVFFFFFSLLV